MLLLLRAYAIAYVVLFVEVVNFTYGRPVTPSVIQLVDMIFFTPIAVMALWSAAFRHIRLPKHGWKVLLFASVFWRPFAVGDAVLSNDAIGKFRKFMDGMTAGMASGSALALTLLAAAGACVLGGLIIVPPLIALYRNGYGHESLLRLMSPPPAPEHEDPADVLAEIAEPQAIAHQAI